MDWLNSVAGFGVGVLVGVTGVGGGALMTPILVLVFGTAPATAVGTDLWFAAVTKLVGGTIHHKKGGVDWQVLRRLATGSLPAAVLTLWWLHASGIGQVKHGFIMNALGVVLVLTAPLGGRCAPARPRPSSACNRRPQCWRAQCWAFWSR